jgi:hypothetical protein
MAILCSPAFHEGPRMIKPSVVLAAGLLRALDKPITGEHWVWLCAGAGRRLYFSPDVAGRDDKRRLDTNTIRALGDRERRAGRQDVPPRRRVPRGDRGAGPGEGPGRVGEPGGHAGAAPDLRSERPDRGFRQRRLLACGTLVGPLERKKCPA